MAATDLQRGDGITFSQIANTWAVSKRSGREWRHPWTVVPSWSGVLNEWVATVEPAFVGYSCPVYRTTLDSQTEAGRDFGINPLTGRPYFSDPIFNQDEGLAPGKRTVEIPLYLGPVLRLPWSAIGFDGQGTPPDFFLRRGAAPAPSFDLEDIDSVGLAGSLATPPAGLRLLRSCSIILHQPRLALTSTIELQPGLLTGISNVTQTLSVRNAVPGDSLRVFAGSFTPGPEIDPLARDYEEATWDEIRVATVYLLSPPNTPIGSQPDATWQPFVRHELFWNLHYEQPRFRILETDPGTPFIPPLAAGAAQLVINFLTASINDLTQQSLNILQSHSLAGTFWAITGGGHDAMFPLETQAAPRGRNGLDKAGRLRAQAAAESARIRQERLDPEFPFRALPFSPDLLFQ